MNPRLPLENILYQKKDNREDFPNKTSTFNYFDRYQNIKKWLIDNIYKNIGAAMADDGFIFTSHDLEHHEAVIRTAGKLLGVDKSNGDFSLRPYETYLLLTAILLHDAGNVYGRDDHEKKPFQILQQMKDIAGDDNFEKKLIANIAEAHSGEISPGNKDTISALLSIDSVEIGDTRTNAQRLAAILRFADEISENRERAAKFLVKDQAMSKKSEVYHKYAMSIVSVSIRPDEGVISIRMSLTIDDLLNKYGNGKDDVFLIDEIRGRLEKMKLEHTYCSRFMRAIVPIDTINVDIEVYDDTYELCDKFSIRLEESGYPVQYNYILNEHPNLNGEALSVKYSKNNG